MSIGIEDADFNRYVLVPFNLEAMKISAYYKKKGEMVVLAPGFVPERHSQFFYRKDYNDGSFPPNLTTAKNVEFGGLAFSNNIYTPLPREIEIMHPDTSLYERVQNTVMNMKSPQRKKIFNNMMEAEHCRLSLDGKTLWQEYAKQFKFLPSCRNLMIHDHDLGKVEGSFEQVKYILSRARTDGWATKVGMKFPIQVSHGADLLNWSSLNSNSTFYSVQFNGVIDDDSFLKWVGSCRQKAVYAQMDYVVTAPWYGENDFVMNLLPKIFHQVIISRSYRIFFSLKYDEDFFSDKKWIQVLRLFNFYMTSLKTRGIPAYVKKIEEDTLFDFASHSDYKPDKRYADCMTLPEIREVFKFVREKNYALFKDFYECNAATLGGRL